MSKIIQLGLTDDQQTRFISCRDQAHYYEPSSQGSRGSILVVMLPISLRQQLFSRSAHLNEQVLIADRCC